MAFICMSFSQSKINFSLITKCFLKLRSHCDCITVFYIFFYTCTDVHVHISQFHNSLLLITYLLNSLYFPIRSLNTVKQRSPSWLFIVCFTLLTFRLDPPGQAISTATQELLRLAEANPGGLASLDPVNDLQLKSIDVVEASMRLRVLQDSLKDFTCIHSPRFPEQVGFFGGFFFQLHVYCHRSSFYRNYSSFQCFLFYLFIYKSRQCKCLF